VLVLSYIMPICLTGLKYTV